MNLSPIALFVYKRPELTKKTIDSLQKNAEAVNSDLFIFSDAAKSSKDVDAVKEVRQYIKTIQGFKSITIFENEINVGLANSIIKGVTKIVNQFGRIIVLEDDMVTSPFFLKYMNEALGIYESNEKVISIHGYIYPVKEKLPETFFLRGADCWGWATWKRGWELFEYDSQKLLSEIKNRKLQYEFDYNGTVNNVKMLKNQISGKVDSWAIRWHASAFLKNKFTLYPGRSLVRNIGMGGGATHSVKTNVFDVDLADKEIIINRIPAEENEQAKKEIEKFFRKVNPNFINRWIKKIIYKF